MIGRLTPALGGALGRTAEPESAKVADSRLETLNEEETAELLTDKDSKNTQKARNVEISSIFKFIHACWN